MGVQMSYLAKLKLIENGENFKNIPDSVLPKPPELPFGSFGSAIPGKNKKKLSNIAAITPEQIQKIQTWLNEICEQEEDQHIVINKARRDPEALAYFLAQANNHMCQKRQEKVLAMLESNPDKQRAYLTEIEPTTGDVILTIGIRGKATFEMEIPKAKYDAFLLAKMIDKDLIH
jgi:hypothetical protein